LFNDPFAQVLAGDEGASLLRHFHTAHASPDGNPFLPIRTRWFDDFLASATADGLGQIVGLGAGLDTRALRLDWPDGTVLFEVDQPGLLAYKADRLTSTGSHPRCDRRTVAVNLAEEWMEKLLDAGYEPSRPTAWFGEGLLFYLTQDDAAKLLHRAAALSAPGSRLAVDLIGTGIFRFPYTREFLRKLADAGSPWQFGTDDPGQFINSNGWRVDQLTEPGRPGADYGRWPALATPGNLSDLPRSYLAAASLPARAE
jgi:methyltransferase (TIGR00027 family)